MSFQAKLYDFIGQVQPLSLPLQAYLQGHLQEQTVKKGDPLFRGRQHASRTWFVCSGLFKSTYSDASGRQVISRMWQENDIVVSKNRPLFEPGEVITAMETSDVLSLSEFETSYILSSFKEAHLIARRIYFLDARQRDLRTKLLQVPPATAYEQFLRHYPAERMLLQDIAAYLNIRPFSLSRIRARRK